MPVKQTTDELYTIVSIDVETLMEYPYSTQISPNITQYSTNSNLDTYIIVQDAKEHDQRVQFFVHDEASNLLIPIGANIGHSPGFDPDAFLNQGKSVRDTLQEFTTEEIGEITIDWVLIDVISNWRNQP